MVGANHASSKHPLARGVVGLLTPAIIMAVGFSLLGAQQSDADLFDPLDMVYQYIQSYFYPPDAVDSQQLLYGALSGMVDALGDPLSQFMDPAELQRWTSSYGTGGAGVGLELSIHSGLLTVITSLEATSASQAGIQPGDQIRAIDGAPTDDITSEEARTRTSGQIGEPIVLTVRHVNGLIEDISIPRDVTGISSLQSTLIADGAVSYIRISALDSEIVRQLDAALASIDFGTTGGIILDLRGCPGGLMPAAISVASRFVDEGVVSATNDRLSGEKLYWSSGNRFPEVPLAVLVDGWTASGAEIVAAAIRDSESGVLVGQRTAGIGTYQQLINFPDGSALKITAGEFFTPKGYPIKNVGLDPSIWVNEDWTRGSDPYVTAALRWLLSPAEVGLPRP